jgi:hypothetical protein
MAGWKGLQMKVVRRITVALGALVGFVLAGGAYWKL